MIRGGKNHFECNFLMAERLHGHETEISGENAVRVEANQSQCHVHNHFHRLTGKYDRASIWDINQFENFLLGELVS